MDLEEIKSTLNKAKAFMHGYVHQCGPNPTPEEQEQILEWRIRIARCEELIEANESCQ